MKDLYDTGSAVVNLFTNFLKFPGESPRQDGSIGGGGGVLGITGPSPSYPSFFTLLSISIKTNRDHQTLPETETGKNI